MEKCNPKRKMKGVSEAVKKNGGVLILDGGMITGMEDLGANLYGAYNLWYPQFMDDEPDLIEKNSSEILLFWSRHRHVCDLQLKGQIFSVLEQRCRTRC